MKKIVHQFGSHLSVAGGVHNALLEAKEYGFPTVQLFVANQRQWQHPPLTDEQVSLFQETQRKTKISPIVAHSSYLINLAAVNADTARKSHAKLLAEYDRCCELGVDYLVMHPGAHMGEGETKGLKKIADGLNTLFDKTREPRCKLLLETTAGQGTCVGHRFEHLAWLIEQTEAKKLIGVCLDTCHIYAAGYDYRQQDEYEHVILEFEKVIGLKQLYVIHINDSKTPLGSRVDRHEHIGKGKIGREGFRNFLNDQRLCHIPFILETPKGKSPGGRDYDKLNVAALRRLIQTK